MYPVTGAVPLRTPVKGGGDVTLGGGKLVIPEGAVLHMPIAAIHLSPALWDNPDKLDPDRWLQVCRASQKLVFSPSLMVTGYNNRL
jgi:cytochrome P450